VQFVLALGNRPKSERGLHLLTLWIYAVLAAYLVVCSVILSVHAFKVSRIWADLGSFKWQLADGSIRTYWL
jgi:hypothetical protein